MSGAKFNKNILIIDDHEDICELFEDAAEDFYSSIERAHSSSAAIEKLKNNLFHTIVLDINLGETNGGSVLKYLVSRPYNLNNFSNVIVSSGLINADFQEKHNERFQAILSKPFTSDQILETFEKVSALSFKNLSESYDASLPFYTPGLDTKFNKIYDQIKKQSSFMGVLKKNYQAMNADACIFKARVGILINITSALCFHLKWFTDKTLEKFIYACLIHDLTLSRSSKLFLLNGSIKEIDKIQMPEELKEEIKEHPQKVVELFNDISTVPSDVQQIIVQHHERPDGCGFPKSLSKTNITPMASLFILAIDLADYIIQNDSWNLQKFIQERKPYYKGQHFRKAFSALEKVASEKNKKAA